ncbi:MAG: TetR/AcrR family transcriptional regulator [Anaerolineae bacterium]|nr:TetR/AcrR family transcriptional regulator [Anaerolineae bacterium]
MARISKKPEIRKQEILEAALELFQTKGYEKTTMRDVMDKLEIAKGTIYHYFNSKDALFEAVVENIVEEDIAQKQALLLEATGDALEKIRILATADSASESHADILEQLHSPGNMGMHTRQLAVAISGHARLYGELIQQGCEEGIFQTEHPLECAEFILAGMQFLTDVGVYPWEQEELMRRAMAFPAIVESMLNAPEGSFSFLIG